MIGFLLFIAAFFYFQSTVFPSIENAAQALWVLSSWQGAPLGAATDYATPLLGRWATALFPAGSPAFRMNVMAALLTAAAAAALLAALRDRRPSDRLPPAAAIERARLWDAAAALTALFWIFSTAARHAARAWGPAAPALLGTALGLLAFFAWRRAARWAGFAALFGLAAGFVLSIDPRALWALPGGLLWAWAARGPEPYDKRRLWALLIVPAAAAVGWAAPAFLEATRASAGAGQSWAVLLERLPAMADAFRPGLADSGQPLGKYLHHHAPVALPMALWGLWIALNRRRAQALAGLLLWISVAFAAPLFNPGRDYPVALGTLVYFYAVCGGILDLFTRRTWAMPALVLLLLPAALWPPPCESRARLDAWDRGADWLRVMPEGAVLWKPRRETGAAVAYQQFVLGRRTDVETLPGFPSQAAPGDAAILGLMDGPRADRIFAEDLEALPTLDAADARPEGLGLRFLPADRWPLASPASLSVGRVPFFFLGPRTDDRRTKADIALGHRRLGQAFARERVMDEAEVEYVAALALAPKDPWVQADLARLYVEIGDNGRATLLFRRAAQNVAGAAGAGLYGELADAELAQGDAGQAIAALERAVRRDGRQTLLRERLADLLEKAVRPWDAAVQWQALRDQHPEEKTYHWRLTQSLTQAQEPVKAFKAVERYLYLDLTEEERADATAFRERLAASVGKKP